MMRGLVRAMTVDRVSVKLDTGPLVVAANALNHRNAPNSVVLVVKLPSGEYAIVGRPR